MNEDEIPSPERITAIIDFLQAANALKDTLRSGFTGDGNPESTAEHSWRLCLLATLMGKDLPQVDTEKLIKLCVIHDLGEAITGDTPAIHQKPGEDKTERERAGMEHLCGALPDDLRVDLMALWDEYAAANTPEAILAKGLDKIETILTHAIGGNPPDFDYVFNLGYGKTATDRHPLLRAVRELADEATQARVDYPE